MINTTILFFSLGGSPGVLQTTLDGLLDKQYEFQKIIIVSNNFPDGKKQIEDIEKILAKYPGLQHEWLPTGLSDLFTEEDNRLYFEIVLERLVQEKAAGNDIIVSIAGGRKTMSALLLVASYIAGIKKVFHFLAPDDLINQQKITGEDIPKGAISVIKLPHLQIDRLLDYLVQYADEEKRFDSVLSLVQQLKTEELFNTVNQYFTERVALAKLKEAYRSRVPLLQRMITATETILQHLLQDKLMIKPDFEKRVKTFESFYKKKRDFEKDGGVFEESSFERLTDLAGVRVIFYNRTDMEKAVTLLGGSGDFIDFKKGGIPIADEKKEQYEYRAIHYDVVLNPEKRAKLPEYCMLDKVPCEVQFKTIFAHSWSKVEHKIRYKEVEEKTLTSQQRNAIDKELVAAGSYLEEAEAKLTTMCNRYFADNI